MAKHILHIDSSVRFTGSFTRKLSAQVVAQFADVTVTVRDLGKGLPLIDEAWIGANFTPVDARGPEAQATLALSDTLIAEIQAADLLVIGAPVYNFGPPATLKAWIDLIARAGVTFQYTGAGPEGLLTGKRAIIVVASGGTQLGSAADFTSTYLRHVLGFIGITDVTLIAADALMIAGEDAVIGQAQAAIAQLA